MIDQNTLKTYVQVAETLNFSVAAARRNTVQSAVSAQIAKLETELQRKLIERGRGKKMRLTSEGEAFLVYARRILALSEEAVEAVQAAHSQRIVRLGTTVTLAMSVVSDVLSAFAELVPDVQIHIQCDRSDALLGRLEADEIDIAFMIDQGKHAGQRFVHSQPLVWVSGPEFEPRFSTPVPLAFQTDGRDLRRYAFEALDASGQAGQIAHLSPHPIGVRAFVLAGLALTVMPKAAVTPPLQIVAQHLDLPPLSSIALSAYVTPGEKRDEISDLINLLQSSVR
ncbi:hypothetical protein DL239_08415 [Sedimentitalea sp. CY04]|uniref:HTH lysR-type domain-containing protein n=1 Tax=Parasedimentitalea denitrificans TaxID=2211118 RepID=A0ABX0W603_9RHOB|nr:LysR family transcriptional regulator [Sedimentitalea sp. CY04]NIZ60997.1 hypothetical protein [Sedimentitalea sp. CY04]